tara:strand:+ start:698 stop:898 length:201 start_codon:yes stop_codon:yes gene_type:complete
MNYNFMSNMQCNIIDVIRTIKEGHQDVWNSSKDEDGSEITVGDCLEDLAYDIDQLYKYFNCDEGRE